MYVRGPLENFVDLSLRVGTLWTCGDSLFFEVPPLAIDALLTTLHPLFENVLQTVCRKLQEDSGTGGFDLEAQKSQGSRYALYGGCYNGDLPISVSASIATFQLYNADAPLSLLRHPKMGSFKATVTPFSNQIKADKMGKACSTHRRDVNANDNSIGIHDVKRSHGTTRCRWEDNIRMDIREIWWEGVDRINLMQDRDQL
jgi:hypothetical protein